jgi:hypothetical protein
MTVTDLSEQQMQDTCPSFCERTEHQNMSTAEAPLIIHSTGDHNVHGLILRISTGGSPEGCVSLKAATRARWVNSRR